MITDKGLQKLAKEYLIIQEGWKKRNEAEDAAWKTERGTEKIFEKALAKKAKLPKSVSITVGNYKISQKVRWGFLKVKKIK